MFPSGPLELFRESVRCSARRHGPTFPRSTRSILKKRGLAPARDPYARNTPHAATRLRRWNESGTQRWQPTRTNGEPAAAKAAHKATNEDQRALTARRPRRPRPVNRLPSLRRVRRRPDLVLLSSPPWTWKHLAAAPGSSRSATATRPRSPPPSRQVSTANILHSPGTPLSG